MALKRIAAALLTIWMAATSNAQGLPSDSTLWNEGTDMERNASVDVAGSEDDSGISKADDEEKQKQYKKIWGRKKYWKLGFANPHMERTDGEEMTWKNQFSVFVQQGSTVYFHPKPLFGMLKFGLDYGFCDLSYTKLKLKSIELSESSGSGSGGNTNSDGFDDIVSDDPSGSIGALLGIDLGMHKFEYALHVGPSISLNPWNHIIVAAYFHAMPTASGILENDKFSYGFGCAMAAGASVSYKLISVGVEGLWSKIKYHQASFGDGDDEDGDNLFTTKTFKLKQGGPRFYVALRF